MLSIKYIREHKEEVIKRLAKKGFKDPNILDEVISLDEERRNVQSQLDHSLAEKNKISKTIANLMREKKHDEAESAKERISELKETSKSCETIKKKLEDSIHELLIQIPNLPADIVPEGRTSEDNICVKEGGQIPNLSSENKMPHWDLVKKFDLIDFELGVKITGAGFPLYKGYGARLQRALISFFLDQAREAGYLEVQPPYIVNENSAYGTGQLPDKEGQMYHCNQDDFYLIPTAEVPVTNIFRDEILNGKDLPICLTAYSACFRREAGSYGKDVRGLNRLHQFDKVEIVTIEKPENSYEALQRMVDYVQTLVERLELPWRILRLCGGDLSFTSALTYDFEVYSAAQEKWLEVSSVSNFESYQANRLMCRYRDEDGKINLCHTLNGSALALPRIVAALLENNQGPDGIKIPEALVPYTGFDVIPLPSEASKF